MLERAAAGPCEGGAAGGAQAPAAMERTKLFLALDVLCCLMGKAQRERARDAPLPLLLFFSAALAPSMGQRGEQLRFPHGSSSSSRGRAQEAPLPIHLYLSPTQQPWAKG